ncbi:MAG: iron-containing alcohol dehydrogenase [Alphaproteobacteria bacterium]|nr:iron-containing alcohol dehydrogenase [Alphaproteobacteria bacterium]
MHAGAYDYVPLERVRWGTPAAAAVAEEARRLGATRVFVIASRTLSRTTPVVASIREALGAGFAGLFDACREHTPIDSVIEAAAAVRAAEPDLLVTAGGGSPIDTTKAVQLCLSRDITRAADLLAIAGQPPSREPSRLRQVIVPTTLSGGEYSSIAGVTDPVRKLKDAYVGFDLCARTVILDPEATLHTPEWLWLSTAIRALDHAVEGYCAPATNPMVQGLALHAMRLFATALRRTKADPSDLEARLQSQQAVWLAASGLGRVPMGASHGIGYLLGTMCGVPHGYTSCVMLPAVLRWNEAVTRERQRDIAAALGMPDAPASDAVAKLVADLGLPRKLGDVGVGEDRIAELAAVAWRTPVVKTNPRPVRDAGDAAEILRFAL